MQREILRDVCKGNRRRGRGTGLTVIIHVGVGEGSQRPVGEETERG